MKKAAGKLEECSYSKVIQGVLNGRNFKYHFWGVRFHMITRSYKFSHSLCWNNLLQVWLIFNQRYQVLPFRYINRADEVYNFVRGNKLLVNMKYLIRSVK